MRRLNAEIINTYANAASAYESWQSARTAADAMQHNAELMARAYSLGEASLSETLNARRLALEPPSPPPSLNSTPARRAIA